MHQVLHEKLVYQVEATEQKKALLSQSSLWTGSEVDRNCRFYPSTSSFF